MNVGLMNVIKCRFVVPIIDLEEEEGKKETKVKMKPTTDLFIVNSQDTPVWNPASGLVPVAGCQRARHDPRRDYITHSNRTLRHPQAMSSLCVKRLRAAN